MSHVFISYAREDQSFAKELADYLQSLGFHVWWDTELLGSDDFNDVIYAALTKARAAIVIWTKSAVKSHFVRDEARFALQHGKLIGTRTHDLDVGQIPFGFQGQHTEDVANRDKIVRALEKLGVERIAAKPVPDAVQPTGDQAAWARIQQLNDLDELFDFMAAYPQAQVRELAKARLRTVMAKSADIGASYSRKGKLSGLWSGLTFRVPHFLMTANSRWVAIGLALGYLISVPLLILLMGSLNFVLHLSPILNTLLSLSVTFLVALLAWRHFHRFVAQRLFIASSIIALTCCALAYMLVVLAYLSLASLTHIPEPDYEQWPVFLVPFLVGLPALSFVYALWRMWRAR